MCVFLYRSGVVKKKMPICFPSLFNERCKIKKRSKGALWLWVFDLASSPFFHGKGKYEFIHSFH